jgi:hypothetical protein
MASKSLSIALVKPLILHPVQQVAAMGIGAFSEDHEFHIVWAVLHAKQPDRGGFGGIYHCGLGA